MKFLITCLGSFLIMSLSFGQSAKQQKVFTEDIDNFWVAFDSIQTTKDSINQIHFIQTLYIDKGSEGLKAFMDARDYSAALWIELINKYPKFWNSIRPNTLSVKDKAAAIEQSILAFKSLYPGLKDAKMYFTIGGLRSGGTTTGNLVLIGTEIATGNALTNVSEFPDQWLARVFREQSPENIIPLNIHEYVHTQQKGECNSLLGHAIREGSCDFITELVIGKPMQTSYIKYGYGHEIELKASFKREMFSKSISNWLYNGSNAKTVADLGYFMGYQICKSYYANASDKKKAVEDIIELNYSDTTAVEAFLQKSGYYKEKINKEELISAYQANQPVFMKITAFSNGDSLVDPLTKEITLVFSKPMNPTHYSINYGKGGKEYYPITGIVGFSNDSSSFTVKTELKPGHAYEFVITNKSFKSDEGYPLLKDYLIAFKTKP